jgi:hypothetical protein
MAREPTTELHAEFSSPHATAMSWSEARDRLELAEIFWISTVRPEARPHVTPLVAVWLDDALFFVTGENELKAKNLSYNPHVVMTTGCAAFRDGFDIVIEGDAVRVTDDGVLGRVADVYASKYDWHYEVRDGTFRETHGPDPSAHDVSPARVLVFEVAPTTVFGYGRGETFSATRWRFSDSRPT